EAAANSLEFRSSARQASLPAGREERNQARQDGEARLRKRRRLLQRHLHQGLRGRVHRHPPLRLRRRRFRHRLRATDEWRRAGPGGPGGDRDRARAGAVRGRVRRGEHLGRPPEPGRDVRAGRGRPHHHPDGRLLLGGPAAGRHRGVPAPRVRHPRQ
ncbi:hypothetical protein ACJX0J_021066, partial [Zea mays]